MPAPLSSERRGRILRSSTKTMISSRFHFGTCEKSSDSESKYSSRLSTSSPMMAIVILGGCACAVPVFAGAAGVEAAGVAASLPQAASASSAAEPSSPVPARWRKCLRAPPAGEEEEGG